LYPTISALFSNSAILWNLKLPSNFKLRMTSFLALSFALVFPAIASTPPSGTLTPANGSSTTWSGGGIAGATTDETTCVDGTDCDVFTVTLTGAPSNYQGLILAINVTHSVSLNVTQERFCHPALSALPKPNGSGKLDWRLSS
jgi:hypothetical protein